MKVSDSSYFFTLAISSSATLAICLLISMRFFYSPKVQTQSEHSFFSRAENLKHVLVYTEPYPDGYGDGMSAHRMYCLLKEKVSNFEIDLWIDQPFVKSTPPFFNTEFYSLRDTQYDAMVIVAGNQRYSEHPSIFYVPEYASNQHLQSSMMKMSRYEKSQLLDSPMLLGKQFSGNLQYRIGTGDYYFCYGRSHFSSLNQGYIETLLERNTAKEPLIVIAPGKRHLEIDSKYRVRKYDYATGQITQTSSHPDLILIRGIMPPEVFRSYLKYSRYDHALVTGDMSLTEALEFGKIPIHDMQYNFVKRSPVLTTLFGEYISMMSHNPSKEHVMVATFLDYIADNERKLALRTHLQQQFLKLSNSSEIVFLQLNDFFKQQEQENLEKPRP